MSLGQDRHWRQVAAEAAWLPSGGRVLDVGVGTGDMALALLERWPEATIVGLDPTTAMMSVGREKPGGESIGWMQGDGIRLPFPDEYFDVVVSAFVMRNVPDVPGSLSEQRRVVREGGRVVCLEMTWPRIPVFRTLFRFYFADVMPRITGLLSGQPAAYRYLPRSVRDFQTPEGMKATMEKAGLRSVRYQTLVLGSIMLHVARR
jgi:demethylmenaquinone methyltransferase/2-methoxy-6-polyprenyl-1,4-benzoquinol methylase